MMKGRNLIRVLFFSICLIILPSLQAWAEEGQRLSLSERMVRLETKVDSLEKNIDTLRAEMRDMRAEMRDMRAEMKGFMLWGFGITFAGIFALIGFVIWDRRTVVAPVARELRDVARQEELILETLRRYGREEPRMAEVIKRVGL